MLICETVLKYVYTITVASSKQSKIPHRAASQPMSCLGKGCNFPRVGSHVVYVHSVGDRGQCSTVTSSKECKIAIASGSQIDSGLGESCCTPPIGTGITNVHAIAAWVRCTAATTKEHKISSRCRSQR